jgi:hypothetical protein
VSHRVGVPALGGYPSICGSYRTATYSTPGVSKNVLAEIA